MNRHLKFWLTTILAGFLMANLTFAAWATEGGPAFDPKFNPDAQETAVPSGPPVLNDNSQEQPSAPAQENKCPPWFEFQICSQCTRLDNNLTENDIYLQILTEQIKLPEDKPQNYGDGLVRWLSG